MRIGKGRGNHRLRVIAACRPENDRQLQRFVADAFALDVSDAAVDPGSTPPMRYLSHAFFEKGDCVVWANRGGGKTMLGAVATVLDLLFKPGIQVRILGGSLEQSSKMYEHLVTLLDRPMFRDGGGVLATPITQRRVLLTNGSRAEVLAGSQRSVRGTRVQKLRCDEVEHFDPAVWDAAQMVTRSAVLDGRVVRGSVEALSTMHRPFGLMSKLVGVASSTKDDASTKEDGAIAATPRVADPHAIPHDALQRGVAPQLANTTVLKWNAMDVAGRCPAALPCEGCLLWNDCGGRAKSATGFLPITDLLAQRRRTSDSTWDAEMMCRRPSVRDSVYPSFDPSAHVTEKPLQRDARWVGGMDFGLRSPHVMLWAVIEGQADARHVHIVDEYLATDRTLDAHLKAIDQQRRTHGWPAAHDLAWVGVDPAGRQRDRHTGLSDIAVLRAAGYRVRAATSRLADGLDLVRRHLDRHTLSIHPRCHRLIRALQQYHFDPAHPQNNTPAKDGPDHLCDALRYLLLNLERGAKPAVMRSYFHA